MLKHHLKIAWRNLQRNKGYSAINIGGLALGMAVVIIIGLWVFDEFSFNTYHKNHDRIAQIYNRSIDPDSGEMDEGESLMYITGTLLKENYGDYFKHILRASWTGEYTVYNNKEAHTQTGKFIESGILEMLSLNMLKGSYTSLEEPNAVVLSESASRAIFGKEDPIGRSLKIDNQMDAVVKGVYEDLPKNTQFEEIKFFANWDLFESTNQEWIDESRDLWDNYSFSLFVELKPEVDFKTLDGTLHRFYIDYAPKTYNELARNLNPQLFMHPMDKWHLYSEFEQGVATGGRITFVWLFIGIGIFVLFLACINFMNLSTARSEKRAKEVGIRKTVGSKKNQLIYQFLSESLLVSFSALLLALVIVLLSLSRFNELSGKAIEIPWTNPVFWIAILAFAIVTGILAGSYPALYLSSFTPIKVLKGTFKAGPYAAVPRKVLVVFQFAVSIMLAVGTLIVFYQIQFTKDRPSGYDKNQLLSVQMNNPDYAGKYNLLRAELKNTGAVAEISQSSSPLTGVYSNGGGFDWLGKDPNFDPNFSILRVTHDYGKTVGWQFVEGRDFSREFASDSIAIVINETAVKYMGLQNPVGTYITRGDSPPLPIIGVTRDMVMQSPYEPVKQAIFFLNYEEVYFMNIKLRPEVSTSTAISKIKTVFAHVVPSANFDYRFVDREYDRKFTSEQRIGNLAGVFTFLAILISCLGLFGLASFIAEQRTKEIGVRKVLGASVYNLWQMLSKDFVVLVLISCLVAIPIAHHFMGRWLENYEYRIEIPWWTFAMAVFGALLITILTVSFQAIRAASINPVKSLRTE
ncbi:MAG: FtsX-like permease family protein [Saonia sp.]